MSLFTYSIPVATLRALSEGYKQGKRFVAISEHSLTMHKTRKGACEHVKNLPHVVFALRDLVSGLYASTH